MIEGQTVTNAEITMGVQLDSMLERHHHYLHYSIFTSDISGNFPDLIGQETKMVGALGKAIVERIGLMDQLGHGGLAREIVQARRELHNGATPRD